MTTDNHELTTESDTTLPPDDSGTRRFVGERTGVGKTTRLDKIRRERRNEDTAIIWKIDPKGNGEIPGLNSDGHNTGGNQ